MADIDVHHAAKARFFAEANRYEEFIFPGENSMKAKAGNSATVRRAPKGAASASAALAPEATIETKPVKPIGSRKSVPAKQALAGNSAPDAINAKAVSSLS